MLYICFVYALHMLCAAWQILYGMLYKQVSTDWQEAQSIYKALDGNGAIAILDNLPCLIVLWIFVLWIPLQVKLHFQAGKTRHFYQSPLYINTGTSCPTCINQFLLYLIMHICILIAFWCTHTGRVTWKGTLMHCGVCLQVICRVCVCLHQKTTEMHICISRHNRNWFMHVGQEVHPFYV